MSWRSYWYMKTPAERAIEEKKKEARILALYGGTQWGHSYYAGLVKKEDSMKCKECGQDKPVVRPVLGVKVNHRYRGSLGVVVMPGPDTLDEQVRVVVVSGPASGCPQNWFLRSVDIVGGHFHIATRKAAL